MEERINRQDEMLKRIQEMQMEMMEKISKITSQSTQE